MTRTLVARLGRHQVSVDSEPNDNERRPSQPRIIADGFEGRPLGVDHAIAASGPSAPRGDAIAFLTQKLSLEVVDIRDVEFALVRPKPSFVLIVAAFVFHGKESRQERQEEWGAQKEYKRTHFNFCGGEGS
jgi:hypothetical protein